MQSFTLGGIGREFGRDDGVLFADHGIDDHFFTSPYCKVLRILRNRLATQLLPGFLRLLPVYAHAIHMGEPKEKAPTL
jgi:hypothetical protein